MTQPLAITSTTHPVAVSAYIGVGTLGFLTLTKIFESKAMRAWLGPDLVIAWATCLALAGIAAAGAALLSPLLRVPTLALAWEGCSAAIVAALIGVYVWAIRGQSAVLTVCLLVTIAVGCLARAWQVVVERRKIRRALARPTHADPPPLADPDE